MATVDVTYVLPYGATAVYPTGWWVEIHVTVRNEGDFTESFKVTAYSNLTTVDINIITDLAPGQNKTLTFVWMVHSPPRWKPYPPKYTIWAEADIVSGEADTSDNAFVDDSVTVKFPGDTNGDGKVNYKDIFLVAACYGSAWPYPPYTPDMDFDCTGKVDYRDLFFLAAQYGKSVIDP